MVNTNRGEEGTCHYKVFQKFVDRGEVVTLGGNYVNDMTPRNNYVVFMLRGHYEEDELGLAKRGGKGELFGGLVLYDSQESKLAVSVGEGANETWSKEVSMGNRERPTSGQNN